MKVLIAYDGSECADAAIADLPRAGLPGEVEAVVFTVGDVFFPPPPPSSYEVTAQALSSRRVASAIMQAQSQASRVLEESMGLAEKGREALRAAFPGWEVRAEAVAGTPASAIIEKAAGWGADLVVVGSHGRTALGRLILGSVSKKVATEAHSSVRVARCPNGKIVVDAPIRLLLGFDGSPSAHAAVRAVARRSWPAGSTVRVVAVDDHPPTASIAVLMPGAAAAAAESVKENLERLRQGIGEVEDDLGAVAGLHVSCEVRQGDPKRVLIEEAERTQADCIFVGSRGLSGRLERWMLGSVSTALVNGAPCSVEVVRG
jgi:nucleotide-binding universal stress UspA family protein